MIALRDAKITDGLPRIIAQQPWAQALAYAVNRQLVQLLDLAHGTRVSASVDTMPDAILDALAVELRLPYYDQAYTIDVKRELVKGAIQYWATAGTVDSLAIIMQNIFGDAEIEEWFSYNGDPGNFRILTTNPNVTGETLARFTATAGEVKRLSAWMEEVIVDLSIPQMAIYQGGAVHDHTELEMTQEG